MEPSLKVMWRWYCLPGGWNCGQPPLGYWASRMCLSPLENARRVDFSSGLARRRRERKRSSSVVAPLSKVAWIFSRLPV